MHRASLALLVLTLLAAPLMAQDWRKDPASTRSYNCDVVDAMAEEYGSENFLRSDAGEITALSEFLFSLFPECPSGDEAATAESDATDSHIKELIESKGVESILVLVENTTLEWGDPACSIMVDDFNETDFNVLTAGHSLDGIQVDVYFPGANQPVEMDVVQTDVTRSGVPMRQEWLEGDDFPLGYYLFEVHIDGETSHFVWQRNDNAMNTFSLVCQDRPPAEADEALDAADAGIEVTAVLDDHSVYSVADDVCTVTVSDHYETDLNVLRVGSAIDQTSIKVYLPGESQAIAMPHSYTNEVEAYGEEIPIHVIWAERDSFPLGRYSFDVQVLGETYRFEWEREDSAVNTIAVFCSELEAEAAPDAEPADESDAEPADEPEPELADGVTARLTDGEYLDLDDGCFIATSNLDSPFFGFAVSGSDHEQIKLTVTYPGAASPMRMDNHETLTGENGTPYRVEWVDEESYPSGIYTIAVTSPDAEYRFEWDRQDDAYRTIFFSCPPIEDDE